MKKLLVCAIILAVCGTAFGGITMDVDSAVIVPVNVSPLTTDGSAIDDGVTYDEAGMDLNWNFVTTAGVVTHTNVVPTTGDDHDWTALGNGMYSIEIPTAAGDVNNDTEGFGWFTGETTATFPWRGPIITFRAAAINNTMVDGATGPNTVVPDAAGVAPTAGEVVDEWETQSQTDPTGFHTNLQEVAGTTVEATSGQFHVFDDEGNAVANEVKQDAAPTAGEIVDEWESQSQTDPTGFHINLKEVADTAVEATSGQFHVLDDEGNALANEAKQDIIDTNVDDIETRVKRMRR